jgi:hypothetical protein
MHTLLLSPCRYDSLLRYDSEQSSHPLGAAALDRGTQPGREPDAGVDAVDRLVLQCMDSSTVSKPTFS